MDNANSSLNEGTGVIEGSVEFFSDGTDDGLDDELDDGANIAATDNDGS